ncbi:MAG: RluA family pseudouridine synthase [Oscillospiraceae bacterium]|nr:RluA family pseudouridine synthase [Oscillospiraceae bacterium]
MNEREFVCGEFEAGERLDIWLREKMPDFTRSYFQRLAGSGVILVNEKPAAASKSLKAGDRVYVPDIKPISLEESVAKEEIHLSVLYEDEHIIAVDKPKGMTVHPAAGVLSGTLVNALLWRCEGELSDINGVVRPGIVHRLDRDTSGVILAAKSNRAHIELSKSFKNRDVKKEYNAIVCGNVKNDLGRIDLPIGRDPNDRKRMSVVRQGGRQAVTLFEVVERFGGFTWLKIDLITGRTHQIRAHMAFIGHPVAGDALYGSKQKAFRNYGQILHSTAIEFKHPVTGCQLRIESPLPEYYLDVLRALRTPGAGI